MPVEPRHAAGLAGVTPTAERYHHGGIVEAISIATEDAEATPGVRVHRSQSPIERYTSRGLISMSQSLAADQLRADWEFGIVGVKSGTRSGTGGGPAEMSAAQLDAATAYREATQDLGQHISAIVLPIVIGDASGGEITVEMLARRFAGYDRRQIMGALKLGLTVLAEHYAQRGSRDRQAKYG